MLALAGCTSVDFQAYEGRNRVMEGSGGTRTVIDGFDVWDLGTPPRRYEILGVMSVDIADGWGAAAIVRDTVAARGRRMGASAAVRIDGNSQFSAVVMSSGIGIPVYTRTTRYAVVRYVE